MQTFIAIIKRDFKRDACEAFRARQDVGTIFQCGDEVLLTLLTGWTQVICWLAAGWKKSREGMEALVVRDCLQESMETSTSPFLRLDELWEGAWKYSICRYS